MTFESMSQVDALIAQAAAVARYQATGESEHADEAARLQKISRVEIGPHGELIQVLDATYVSHLCTENVGGGSMADLVFLTDGRVLALSDEAVGVYKSKDDFFAEEGNLAINSMWLKSPESSALPS